jgi:MerR family transcriptional regulator, light-induced transcriptional regulator
MSIDRNLLTIGALSRAIGVPIETIRTWERRYGVPSAERTEAGHRRYPLAMVERLLWVARAVERGHPPSLALRMDAPTLRQIAGEALAPAAQHLSSFIAVPGQLELDRALAPWFEHVERFEGRAFERELRRAWAELGAVGFIDMRAGPFLVELGARWARNQLSVGHEHFASERLREFLVQQWRPLSDAATGAAFVCATPAGEAHVLGLHLAALTLAVHNARVVFLGSSAPAGDLAQAARHHGAAAVVLSASAAIDRANLSDELAALRSALPAAISIVCGGAGFCRLSMEGVQVLSDFADLARWAGGGSAPA